MTDQVRHEWPLYEVFVRAKRGLNHVHVGSLRAADHEMALHHARDLYTRRNEGGSIWVVRSDDIVASGPDATMSSERTTQMLTPSLRRV